MLGEGRELLGFYSPVADAPCPATANPEPPCICNATWCVLSACLPCQAYSYIPWALSRKSLQGFSGVGE